MKDRSTGTMTGVWQPLALISQSERTLSLLQNPLHDGSKSIGDYKQEVESSVDTTSRLAGPFVFSTALMEPILTHAGETLVTYLGMDAAMQRPYDTLYKDIIVTIIMTKNCGYSSIRKWLAQQYTGPNGQVYPTSSNDLLKMMNS